MLKNVPVSSVSELVEGYYDHPNRTGLTTEEFVDMGEHSCLSPPPDGNQPRPDTAAREQYLQMHRWMSMSKALDECMHILVKQGRVKRCATRA